MKTVNKIITTSIISASLLLGSFSVQASDYTYLFVISDNKVISLLDGLGLSDEQKSKLKEKIELVQENSKEAKKQTVEEKTNLIELKDFFS